MRILNRPMFKYGGPIKEGVMHGMRNNYRSGQLVKPGPGRPGYGGSWDPRQWGLKKAGIYAASKIPSFSKGWAKRAWSKIKPTSVPKYQSTGQLYKTPFVQSQIPAWKRGLSWMKANPGWTAGSALYGGAPAVAVSKASVPAIKAVSKTIADVAVPDWIYNWETGRWFNPDDTDLKPEDKKILKEKKTEAIGAGAQFKEKTAPIMTDSMRDKLAKDAQNKRLKSYLDMMGYDSAKKGALSDALIDASAIVQQGTDEAGSLKEANWGKLINQAIQTTSKRLDKPEQIREAVGLMSVKAAIEKDLEDPQVKKLRALQIEDAEEKLNTGFEKDMAAFILARKDAPDKSQIERFARLKADEYDLKFTMIADKVIEKIPEDATEKERMEIAGIVDDGIYMIGSDIIRVKDKKIKQIA